MKLRALVRKIIGLGRSMPVETTADAVPHETIHTTDARAFQFGGLSAALWTADQEKGRA